MFAHTKIVRTHTYTPDRVVDSIAKLTDPTLDWESWLPPGDGSDDSVHDIAKWREASV